MPAPLFRGQIVSGGREGRTVTYVVAFGVSQGYWLTETFGETLSHVIYILLEGFCFTHESSGVRIY